MKYSERTFTGKAYTWESDTYQHVADISVSCFGCWVTTRNVLTISVQTQCDFGVLAITKILTGQVRQKGEI